MPPTGEFPLRRGKEFHQASPIITRTHFLKKPWYKQRSKGGETKLLLGPVKDVFEGWPRILSLFLTLQENAF